MKKFIYFMGALALTAAATSCADTEKPVFQKPTTFIVNAPALANEYLATTGDMASKETFQLTCSQPDYGFAAKADYNAQVSLTGEFKDEVKDEEGNVVVPATYVTIANQDLNNANMTLRTYDLAVAMCSLLNITDEESWEAYIADHSTEGYKVYFKATCRINGVADSFIASNNTVSYNNVSLSYAVPTAGKIYIVGKVGDIEWLAPSEGNYEVYQDYTLVEPEIGCKIYAGTFTMPASKSDTDIDNFTDWRFFTELNGWADTSVQYGSYKDDFYKVNISEELYAAGLYHGDAVHPGQGNWTVYLAEPTVMTFAVSLVVPDAPKVWFYFGKYDVTIGQDASGNAEPIFTLADEEE